MSEPTLQKLREMAEPTVLAWLTLFPNANAYELREALASYGQMLFQQLASPAARQRGEKIEARITQHLDAAAKCRKQADGWAASSQRADQEKGWSLNYRAREHDEEAEFLRSLLTETRPPV